MTTYSERTGWEPAFRVRYRFLSPLEGGRESPPRQHVRWDFLYAGDDPLVDGIFMIWPEFVAPGGDVLAEGEVPMQGLANMYIVNPDLVSLHRERVTIGTKGYFMEGGTRVAGCEVVAVVARAQSNAL